MTNYPVNIIYVREGWRAGGESIRLDALIHLKLEESFSKIAIVAYTFG